MNFHGGEASFQREKGTVTTICYEIEKNTFKTVVMSRELLYPALLQRETGTTVLSIKQFHTLTRFNDSDNACTGNTRADRLFTSKTSLMRKLQKYVTDVFRFHGGNKPEII
jgi:hypothetical protein